MPNSTTHGAQSTPQTADTLAEAIAQRCEDAHPYQNGWRARCPAHLGQSDTSLSVEPASDRVLLHCHAECDTEDVLQAIGLKLADLFLIPSLRVNGQTQRTKIKRRIVKVYDYYDVHGARVHQTVRYEPKDFCQRRPDPVNPGKYIWNLDGIEPVLYRLPQLLTAVQQGETVSLCEGEKGADALAARGLTTTCSPMGAGKNKWRPSYTEALRGADVVILPDNDPPGAKHGQTVAHALHGVAASVTILELPNLPAKGDVFDWLQAGGTRTELEALAALAPVWEPAAAEEVRQRQNGQAPAEGDDEVGPIPPEPDERPVISITTEMTRVVDQGQAALLALPEAPVIFQRARRLCIIARGVPPPKWLHRPQDAPVILEASPARLCELVAQAARWEKYDARKDEWVSALPPGWFVETLQGRPAWPFPVLEGIIGAPTLRPDGSVLDTPGYDASTGLWFDSNGTRYPALADKPTRDQARKAVKDVHDVLQDFPFVGSGFAAALSAILSIVCRFTIRGCVPLFAARSTTRGSGKGLLVDVLSIIGTGHPAPRWPQSDNDEEDRKRLLTVAMAGDATMHIDNVVKALGSPALDLALTAPSVTDRILGKSAKVEAPLTMVWFASGNNMQFKGDTARRVVPMDIDPQMERPEERTGFAYPHLLDHVHRKRPTLVWAALTIVHAYFQDGTPAQGLSPYGSFQEWSDIIRSAVVWAVDADPCEGRKALEAESDPAFERLATLLECWHACYGNAEATVVQVLHDVSLQATPIDMNNPPNKWHALQSALSTFDPTYRGHQLDPRAIGTAMSRSAGRIVDGKRLIRGNTRTKAGYPWRVDSLPLPVAGVTGVSSVTNPNPMPESVRGTNPEESQIQRETTKAESLTVSENALGNDTLDTPVTPAREVSPSTCPHGGRHTYMPMADSRRCSRCNALADA